MATDEAAVVARYPGLRVQAEPRYFVRVRKNAHVGLCTAAIAIWLWSAIGLAQPTAAAPEQPSAPPNLGLYKIELRATVSRAVTKAAWQRWQVRPKRGLRGGQAARAS